MQAFVDPATSVRVPKTAELVAAHIRRRIVRGELREGDALPPESVLMDEFAISRPTLREAFRILESEGLITVRRGARGGARVQIPTSEVAARYAGLVLQHRGTTLADVLDARVIVEAPAAGIVAGRRDRAKAAAELRRWLEEHPAEDAPQFHGFNRLLVQLTGNETLILLTTMLEAISDAVTASYRQSPPRRRRPPDPQGRAHPREADRADRVRRRGRRRGALAQAPHGGGQDPHRLQRPDLGRRLELTRHHLI